MIEYDLAPSFMLYFTLLGLGQFYVVAAVFAYLTLFMGALLVLAYQKSLYKLIIFLRIFLVLFTIAGFINLFVDNMMFNEVYTKVLG